MHLTRLGLIGFGEVGGILGQGLTGAGLTTVGVWDRWLAPEAPQDRRSQMLQRAQMAGHTAHPGMAALCAASDFLISAVTASNTLAVAQEAAAHLLPGTVFLDLNSASPGTKQQAAQAVEAAGGVYVEAGVMTSVPPYGIRVPMLLGGPQAAALAPVLQGWGMDVKVVSEQLGVASAIKMCRSVMIKGLEALVIESYTTARAYGVEDQVLPTLAETFPGIDWEAQGSYFFSRVIQHGQRRAEEMRESARTVHEAGFAPWMTAAIADKQQWVADQAVQGVFTNLPRQAPWRDAADRLIQARPAPDALT